MRKKNDPDFFFNMTLTRKTTELHVLIHGATTRTKVMRLCLIAHRRWISTACHLFLLSVWTIIARLWCLDVPSYRTRLKIHMFGCYKVLWNHRNDQRNKQGLTRCVSSHMYLAHWKKHGDAPTKQVIERIPNSYFYTTPCATCEVRWNAFVSKWQTRATKKWLKRMYNKRRLWVVAFLSEGFWLGMKNNQMNESLNSCLHLHRDGEMTLVVMIVHYENVVVRLREKEAHYRRYRCQLPTQGNSR
jgi:hypothetical protein